jgi:NAD(P)-dependent dehydrogenase (short-subunit alcohol dehydrogenase family)
VGWDVGAGLEGSGFLVTGAAGGIGRAVVAALASAGARVLATGLDQPVLEDLVSSLEGEGHIAQAADLRDLATHRVLVERVRTEFGNIRGLVHLAAISLRRASPDDVTEDDWDSQHDVNLKAAFFLCRAAGAAMVEQGGGGRIITFASQAWATGGLSGSLVYAATKGGIVSMSRGLARFYGPHAITVNTVVPGLVATPMIEGMDPAAYDLMVRQIPLGHVASPEDVAGTVVFLASDHARYMTGATLNVTGGFLMH